MKPFKVTLLSLIVIFSISFSISHSYGVQELNQGNKAALRLVLRFRDYETDMPISNITVVATISTDWGTRNIGPVLTDEMGMVKASLGTVVKQQSPKPSKLTSLRLSNNYTLIKVQELFIENMEFSAEYVPNFTKYTGLQINLKQKDLGNEVVVEGNLWLLKGKLIRISDREPLSGERTTLLIRPAVKALIEANISDYEGYYFFPLAYEITIRPKIYPSNYKVYPKIYQPLTIKVDENTTLVNWTWHIAKEYVKVETFFMDEEMRWLSSSGHPLNREMEEYQAIKSLLERTLDLYQKQEYGPALGGARISVNRLDSLKKWLSELKTMAIVSSVSICLFAYGIASLLSSLTFEEPSESKNRLTSKILAFSLIMLTFSLTHPSLKIAYAMLLNSKSNDILTSLFGTFLISSVTYFFIELISIKKTPITDLALQLGIRGLKRRWPRTMLTLITITLIVSSAIVFVNISISRTTRVKETWKGTNISGVLVMPDVEMAPLSEYDINWTRTHDWCVDLAYIKEVRTSEWRLDGEIRRTGVLLTDSISSYVNIIGIDPIFNEKYYNLSEHLRGFWQDFSEGTAVAFLPATYNIQTNEYVTLAVQEYLYPLDAEPVFLGTRKLGEFRVVGNFDPLDLSKLRKIDNTPLFEDTLNLVLIPIKSAESPVMAISETTIILKEGFNPVDIAENLAYMLGVPTVANKDGLALRIEWLVELSTAGLIPYLPPLAIASLMMYVTMASVYEERRREFITLATLGLDPKNTFQIFLIETLLLGLMGTFLAFFGSYALVIGLSYLTTLLWVQAMPISSSFYANWSMPAILVALFAGVVMVFLGGLIPSARAQGLSLMGRVKKRQLIGELISEGNVTTFTLPIRETIRNGEMLYTYVRESLGKFKHSVIDPHSIKGEIYGDGSFTVSFIFIESSVLVPCEIKGIREGETLIPVIEFPTRFKEYSHIREILRGLEEHVIGFSAWKDMQLKMQIVHEAPKKQKTVDELLSQIQAVIEQIKDSNKKLKILDAQKGKLSEEVYNEFKQKYMSLIEEKSKDLRSMAIGLEPYSNELQGEIKNINIEIERITTAYSLGEITEEEYIRTCGPLQGRLATLRNKLKELEEIFDFLKRPLSMV